MVVANQALHEDTKVRGPGVEAKLLAEYLYSAPCTVPKSRTHPCAVAGLPYFQVAGQSVKKRYARPMKGLPASRSRLAGD